MTPKQKRFAQEYVIDHNATTAAIRAGYAERSAKQQGYDLLQKPEVAQLVGKLDAEKAGSLGISAQDTIARVLAELEKASQLQPEIWKGEPVTFTDGETGEVRVVVEFVSAALTGKLLEQLFKKAGFDVSRTTVEHQGEVVFSLSLARDLSEEDE